MTSVNLKDIAQEALQMIIISYLVLIVICFFAYTIVSPELLDVTIMPLMVFVTAPILFVITIIITWIYRNYVIWKEIRDKHQQEKSVRIKNGMIYYPSGGFERQMKQK